MLPLTFFRSIVSFLRLRAFVAWSACALGATQFSGVARASEPVEFVFEEKSTDVRLAYARELWAEVILPSGKVRTLPAFFAGDGRFAVRARAEEAGVYRLGQIVERAPGGGEPTRLTPKLVGGAERRVAKVEAMAAVTISREDPAMFVLADGSVFTPIGVNLAWAIPATGESRADWFRRTFAAAGRAGHTWTRVWMASWGGLNPDWLPEDMGASPPIGVLDLRVAANWDAVLAAAAKNNLRVQLVLQHHGQWSSQVNSNWSTNPWNVANGGFLTTPSEFFTSPIARDLSRLRYRYMVARHAWSPAIMAWELFNEVHWTDAYRLDKNIAAVAAWHDEMADYVRSIDVYDHLVTTSTDNVLSPIYARMDFLQPHLYATNMLANLRRFDVPPASLGKPVFYGEFGDDHIPVPPALKKDGVLAGPLAWLGLMGDGRHAGQLWVDNLGVAERFIAGTAAPARFYRESGLAARAAKGALRSFSAPVESEARFSGAVVPGQSWHRRPAPEVTLTFDGSEPVELADVPGHIVSPATSARDGFMSKVTFRVNLREPARARLDLGGAGVKGAIARVSLNGERVVDHSWPNLLPPAAPAAPGAPAPAAPEAKPAPVTLNVNVPAGPQTLVIENVGDEDWFQFVSLDLGRDLPVIGALGRRDADFVALWLWHRAAVFAEKPATPATATVLVPELAAGKWRVTWWDAATGESAKPVVIEHAGGTLRLATPPIGRHAAVVLDRL